MDPQILTLIQARRDAQAALDAANAALVARLDAKTFYSEQPAPAPIFYVSAGKLVEVTPTSLAVPAPAPADPTPAAQ